MTKQEMKEYYKHIEYEKYNYIEIIDLYHEKGDSNRHVHLVFEQNKLYYTGDMGTYVFGENIQNVKEFFKGFEIEPYYWSEKLEAASEPVFDYDLSEESVRISVENDLFDDPDNFKDNSKTDYKEDVEEALSSAFSSWSEDKSEAYDALCNLYNELGYKDGFENAERIIKDCKCFNKRFLFACNLIQWVENEIL